MRPGDLAARVGRLIAHRGSTARRAARRAASTVTRTAERVWRLPLLLASALFAMSGVAQAFGKTDTVFYATLVCVVLGGAAVPLGLLALLAAREPGEDQR